MEKLNKDWVFQIFVKIDERNNTYPILSLQYFFWWPYKGNKDPNSSRHYSWLDIMINLNKKEVNTTKFYKYRKYVWWQFHEKKLIIIICKQICVTALLALWLWVEAKKREKAAVCSYLVKASYIAARFKNAESHVLTVG